MHAAEDIEQAEEIVERVAAIDIAKASGMVCTRLPHDDKPGKRVQRVWNVGATTNAILELADHLRCQGVTRVVMEATGSYWKCWFFLLEAAGLQVWLVNARDVKNVPGRPKTDKLDAIWLAKLTERGMLRPSFVPPKPIRQLRDLTRTRTVLTEERTRHKQRVEKLLEDAQIKLSTVATDIFGVSGRAMMDALIAGQRNPKVLAEMARARMRNKKAALIEALTGQFENHHARLCRMLLDLVDSLDARITELTTWITDAVEAMPRACGPESETQEQAGAACLPLVERLDEIPGIGIPTAQVMIAELGLDMGVFPTPGHLASWAKLSPRTIQSGNKNTSGPTGKGNSWLKGALGDAAMSAAKTDTFLGARYRKLVKRRGHKKALVAVARSILVIVWHLINDPTARFADLGSDWHTRRLDPERRTRDLLRQLKDLGHDVTLTPAAA
ncbi:IS110 family transposase (plasmid) [Streptomyces sp. NBC_00289]|uniref:IS110 family transposase n=1 Tax=Streptomyces sp. NBC_00289 TaxID=2975703 RepID=UPI002F919193